MVDQLLEYIAKGVLKNGAIKVGSKALGRSLGPLFLLLSVPTAIKTFKTFSSTDIYKKQILELEPEADLWFDSIELIGREPYEIGDIVPIRNISAIDSLGMKEEFYMPTGRNFFQSDDYAPNTEYHMAYALSQNPTNIEILAREINAKMRTTILPSPKTSKLLIEKVLGYVNKTTNPLKIEHFDSKKEVIIEGLNLTYSNLGDSYQSSKDYHPFQKDLENVVGTMKNIETEYDKKLKELGSKYFRRLIYLRRIIAYNSNCRFVNK